MYRTSFEVDPKHSLPIYYLYLYNNKKEGEEAEAEAEAKEGKTNYVLANVMI